MEYTPVHNRFWSDGWVRQLNALDRYLFLYLLTNGRAKHTGIYELPLDLMGAESGIDEKDLRMAMLQRLEPKVYYKEGWVILTNYSRHHINNSPDYRKGVNRSFMEIPSKIREIALSYGYVPVDPPPTLPPPTRDNRIEENRIDNTAKADLLEVSEESEDRPKKKETPDRKEYESMCKWLEGVTGVKIIYRVKQYAHLKRAREANISKTRLKERANELLGQPFYQQHGLDWGGVVSSFDRKV